VSRSAPRGTRSNRCNKPLALFAISGSCRGAHAIRVAVAFSIVSNLEQPQFTPRGIVNPLSLQSRSAPTPEAAHQLTIAARRVSAIGRVHHRLHFLDQQDRVEFKQYLQRLCEDLSGLLFQEGSGYAIVVEGTNAEIPAKLAIPLGFIVNELITNSAKYAEGHITVRIDALSAADRTLSVIDDGPGLPAGFAPSDSKGLGMKIVQSLVQQIGGELHMVPGDNGRGTRVTVKF